ncbi:hypothetical protein B9Z47_11900 [Limnohabitans sp. 2KL-1]|uniref:hypothetical protein n=1 Tax=Limnohabitans sp. 2KL-1 TaxID=1100699 RepID=UPI000D3AFAE1|nr:hypothetical protein [Limnohabitans sp. 2KL-1]PUE47009.1 hypothetical protein B9Z47_11900 [Limnohabitans sp. 2KL-1]
MQILRTAEAVQHYFENKIDAEVGRLVVERMEELTDEDFSMEDLVVLVILESGDGIEQLQDQLNMRVITDLGSPLWEVIEEHSTCYELVFVLSSSGYGTLVFASKAEAAPDILALCQEHAYRSPPDVPPGAIDASVDNDTAHRGGFLLPVQKGNQ